MPGIIGQNRHQHRKVFHQITPPGHTPVSDDHGGYDFVPHRSTRDAARPAPTTPTTQPDVPGILAGAAAVINQVAQLAKPQAAPRADPPPRTITRDALGAITPLLVDIGNRLLALEAKRNAALREQMQPVQPARQQPQVTTQPDHQQRAPTHDGVNTMLRNQLAPTRHLTFDATSHRVRDQDYGEQKQVSRFDSKEQDRLARYTPPGSAGSAHERADQPRANMDLQGKMYQGSTGVPIDWSGRDAKTQHNVSGPPGSEAFSNDPNESFANELNAIPSGNPISGINAYNKAHHAARTSDARARVERTFQDWRASYDARGGMNPFAPRQAVADGPSWSSLYEANKGTIGGDPDKIQVGQQLNMPGGGTHTVKSGETLSGIASTPEGADLGSKSLASERGGVEPSGGNYSAGGDLKVSEPSSSTAAPSSSGGGLGGKSLAAERGGVEPSGGNYSAGGGLKVAEGAPSSMPTPSTSSGAGGALAATPSSSSSETPTPPVKPASLGGTGESPSGLNPQAGEGGGASPTGSEGTGLAKMVRGWVQGESE
jgi:LysM repeat protein